MSPSFKGIIGLIISIVFFFPWVWMGMFNIKLSAIQVLITGLVAAIIAIFLGYQSRKGGARVWGIAALSLGTISLILNALNLFAVITSRM